MIIGRLQFMQMVAFYDMLMRSALFNIQAPNKVKAERSHHSHAKRQ